MDIVLKLPPDWGPKQPMIRSSHTPLPARTGFCRAVLAIALSATVLAGAINLANAQERPIDAPSLPMSDADNPLANFNMPILQSYGPTSPQAGSLATAGLGEITLAAQLTEEGGDIPRGLVWRVFSPISDPNGKLPLIASSQGGTTMFHLEPGTYLVHAAFGRAGATKRISVNKEAKREVLVLEAGGLKLGATIAGDIQVPADKLRFSIFDNKPDATGERGLIIPDVSPGTIVRLNAGTYHVVSNYGSVNAVIRADIRVESGRLTDAVVEHKAAQVTIKLVRESGGEAIADTSWSILTTGGDAVQEAVGAYASMVLAEGDYTAIARNRDRVYSRDFSVTAGIDQDVDVVATEENSVPTSGDD